MITFQEFMIQEDKFHAKHPKDYANGKRGWVSGNPRYGDKGSPSTKAKKPETSRYAAKKELQDKLKEI